MIFLDSRFRGSDGKEAGFPSPLPAFAGTGFPLNVHNVIAFGGVNFGINGLPRPYDG